MENFLLVLDELDDLYAMAGLVWRPVVSFLAAVLLFVATGFVFYAMPMTVAVLSFVLVAAGIFESIRRRRAEQAALEPVELGQ
jgi:hypothetical protein